MDTTTLPVPIIHLDSVTKNYGRIKALDGISVSVKPGAIGLLGPNGAGKSTLIKMLLGLVEITSGRASVLGHDIRKAPRVIRHHVGYMPEDDFVLAGLKGVETVAFAGELAGIPPLAALRRAHEILDYVTLGEERYREVQTYSTGMRQKIKLAQALIHSPKLVFLDEPTSGLDPKGREKMLALMRDLYAKRGISVVLSTHILKDVEACCASVMILKKGRLLVYNSLEGLSSAVDGSYRVRFDGDGEAFRASLRTRNWDSEPTGRAELRVMGNGVPMAEAVFTAARAAGVTVRQIVPSRTSLEDIFLQSLKDDEDAGA